MFEKINKKIRSINPWIRFLCVILASSLVGLSTYLITANVVPPLTAQATLTLDENYLPTVDKYNGLAGAFSSQKTTASKDERVTRLLLAIALETGSEEELDARYAQLKPLLAKINDLDVIEAELDSLIANAKQKPAKEAEMAKINEELNDLYEAYDALWVAENPQNAELDEQINALYTELEPLVAVETDAIDKFSAKKTELDACNAVVDSYLSAEDLAVLEGEIADLEKKLAEQEAEQKACNDAIAELKAVDQNFLRNMQAVQERVGDTQAAAETAAELERVTSALSDQNTLGREIKQDITNTKKQLKELQAMVTTPVTEEQLDEAKSAAESLKAEVEALEAEKQKAVAAADRVRAQIAELEEEKSKPAYELNEKINAANERMNTLTNDLNAMVPANLLKLGDVPADTADMVAYIADMKARIADVRLIEELRGYLTIANEGETSLHVKAQSEKAEDAMLIADEFALTLNEQIAARVQKMTQENLTADQNKQAGAEAELQKYSELLPEAVANLEAGETQLTTALESQGALMEQLLAIYGQLPENAAEDNWNEVFAVYDQLTEADAAVNSSNAMVEKARKTIDECNVKSTEAAAAIEEAQKAVAKQQALYEHLAQGNTVITLTAAEKAPSTDGRVAVATIAAVAITALLAFIILSGQPLFDSFNTIFFLAFTVLCVFPFYYLFINTISDNQAVTSGRVNFLPTGLHIQNYIGVFEANDIPAAFAVTTARTIIGTVLMVLVSAWAGYLVTKKKMWRRSFMYRALVMTMYFNAGLIPWYMNMYMLGLTNTFLAYILPGLVAPYNIILVKTYIESIPASLEESAVIDGANTPTVFLRIILPLSVPILATIAIFGAVGNWNSFQDSLLLMDEGSGLQTLQHRLYIHLNRTTNMAAQASGSGGLSQQAAQNMLDSQVLKYTISMVTVIPILLVYPFMQRFFVKGIMLGAVKG